MEIEFDADKDAANIAKHGGSLGRAAEIDMEAARVSADDRQDYGKDRFIAIGSLDGRLHVLIFTVRDEAIRVISLRKANKREVKRYDP